MSADREIDTNPLPRTFSTGGKHVALPDAFAHSNMTGSSHQLNNIHVGYIVITEQPKVYNLKQFHLFISPTQTNVQCLNVTELHIH